MKANSLEELVTNSNIAGELRNYTDWHTRLVKFAQLVANWQKDALLEWLEQNRTQAQMWFDKYATHDDLAAKQVWEEVIDKLNEM